MSDDQADTAIRASWPARRALPACAADCRQGRSVCPCPQACLQADDEPADRASGWWLVALCIGLWLLVVGVVALGVAMSRLYLGG